MRLNGLFFFMGFIWITAATEELLEITAEENVNVSLKCTARLEPTVDYRAVRWYKEGVDPRLTGLVSRSPPDGKLRWYVGADMNISLEYPSLSLLLPPVSCSDSGVYQCYMAAPVGQQNREGRVRLRVQGCPTEPPVTPGWNDDRTIEEPVMCFFTEPKDSYLIVCGAVAVLISALIVFFLSYRSLKNALWQKTKTPEKEPYPDPNSPPEKQDLLWISTLGPSPKKSDISVA